MQNFDGRLQKFITMGIRGFLLLLFFTLSFTYCRAQVFKNLTDSVKSNLEYRAQEKLNQQINKGIDSLARAHPKKNGKQKTGANNKAAWSIDRDSVPAVPNTAW